MQNKQEKRTGLIIKKIVNEITDRLICVKNAAVTFLGKLGEEQDSLVLGRVPEKADTSVNESYRIRRRLAFSLFFTLLGFLFAGTSFFYGAKPFALALMCASGYAGTVFVYIGAVIGTIISGESISVMITAYTLTLGVRVLLSSHADASISVKSFEENLTLRCLISGVAAFLLGLGEVISETFSAESIYVMIFMTVSVPIFTAAFRGALGRGVSSTARDFSVCVILFVLIYSLREHTFFGLSFSVITASFITFYIASTNGFLRGSLVGIICGLAVDPTIAPAFAILGMTAGALRVIGVGVSVALSTLLTCITIVYTGGASLLMSLAGNILFAAVIFWPLSKSGTLPGIKIFSGVHENVEGKYADEKRRSSERGRLAAMSESFDALATTFLKMSDRHRYPGTYELREMCNAVINKHCRNCPLNTLCWQKDYEDMSEVVDKFVEKLREAGTLERGDLPEKFRKRCRSAERMISDINSGAAELLETAIKRDKTELFALDYEAMSELLRDAISENDEEFSPDHALARNASSVLGKLGVHCAAWGAWGKRKKTLVASGIDIGTLAVSSAEIRRALSDATGLTLGDPKFVFEGDNVTMTLESRENYKVDSYTIGSKKKDESESGDIVRTFDGENKLSYAIICDGMGSGHRAAECAGISALFIEKMLSAGNFKGVTMKMLSNFIRSRGEECHCTVDLFEFDRLSGEGIFVKCGAAASYILRNGNLFKIDANTMPLGIMREINAENIKMTLQPDDLVIMMSDGVAHCLEDALWVPEVIISCGSVSCENTARALYTRAINENGQNDDISIAVMKVSSVAA
ncbi:MAG: hypothetical protein E7633_01420 [Ruminococcaceae bacterium]|nr:hypothetical protein [Oscillospiraceae bacterium]